jgi:hypothetical protein
MIPKKGFEACRYKRERVLAWRAIEQERTSKKKIRKTTHHYSQECRRINPRTVGNQTKPKIHQTEKRMGDEKRHQRP